MWPQRDPRAWSCNREQTSGQCLHATQGLERSHNSTTSQASIFHIFPFHITEVTMCCLQQNIYHADMKESCKHETSQSGENSEWKEDRENGEYLCIPHRNISTLISNAILMQQWHEKSSFYCIKGQRRRSSITLPDCWGTREANKQKNCPNWSSRGWNITTFIPEEEARTELPLNMVFMINSWVNNCFFCPTDTPKPKESSCTL